MIQGVSTLSISPAITRTKLSQLRFRMVDVLRLRIQTYAELREDQNASGQAVAVLFFASLSLAFGYSVWNLNYQGRPLATDSVLIGTFTYLLGSLLANLVW